MSTLLKLTLALLGSVFITHMAHATIAIDDTPWPPEQPQIQGRSLAALPVDKRPVFVHAFIHDDVKESQSAIYAEHFLPMVKEIKAFNGRPVSIQFIRNQGSYTDYAYKNEDEQAAFRHWNKLALQYRDEKNLPYARTTKFLLITKDDLSSRVGGIAGVGQQTGIASLKRNLNVGHELGHMLDAAHEHSDVLYRGGWWCDTYMVPSPNLLTSNCHVYTDANREKINDFLKNVP